MVGLHIGRKPTWMHKAWWAHLAIPSAIMVCHDREALVIAHDQSRPRIVAASDQSISPTDAKMANSNPTMDALSMCLSWIQNPAFIFSPLNRSKECLLANYHESNMHEIHLFFNI